MKCYIEFHYPKNIIELEDIIEEFKMISKTIEAIGDGNANQIDYLSSFYSKNNKKRDRMIVVNDVSGLVDRSEKNC